MGSNAKKKTTMAKLNREQKMREKRQEKESRKAARKLAAGDETNPDSAAYVPQDSAAYVPQNVR